MLQTNLENSAAARDAALFIGLMSGTSLDGVDGVLARFAPQTPSTKKATLGRGCPPKIEIIARASQGFPEDLRSELLALNARGGTDELHRAALAANSIAFAYADVVHALLKKAQVAAHTVAAIAAHGQTLRHQPGLHDGVGYTLQILNAALLAERTGIGVVADLRSRDVAAGGQGAPLVPAFHDYLFRPQNAAPTFILNIGGISNISILSNHHEIIGFDCGPGNALMDFWCFQNTTCYFDDRGKWAAGGKIISDLLNAFLDEPFFKQKPPKSTGRDLFNPNWLYEKLKIVGLGNDFKNFNLILAQDIQSTITELTARACTQSILDYLENQKNAQENSTAQLFVCGGGAFNDYLLSRLQTLLGCRVQVATTQAAGLAPLDVEAAAFAWLAREFIAGRTGNLPAVTGAQGRRILGAWYPA